MNTFIFKSQNKQEGNAECVSMKLISWLMKKVLEEDETFNANYLRRRMNARPPGQIHQSISRIFSLEKSG